ncbi:MAG: phenylacetic acid degradation protein PaaN [Bacteroidia bacterium]
MDTTTAYPALFEKHRESIAKAIEALHNRTFYAHYPESPSKRIYGETAPEDGQARFEAQLGQPFVLRQESETLLRSAETSPYTRQPLGISYPVQTDPMAYIALAQQAFASWKKVDLDTRAGLLMEALDRIGQRFFEMAHATMHTTGQTFIMSFQASGPHGNDRALEALALGYYEQTRFPQDTVEWVKPMGKFDVRMDKRFRCVPRGIGLCIGVSTFPVWNTVPGIFANLITGNVAIVKPHPLSVYPLAIVVQELQQVLAGQGFDPHAVQLAVDLPGKPVTTILAEHPAVKLIDFTGGSAYGNYLEGLPGKITFTEKAGVNSVILDSTHDVKGMISNLAFSLSMYSGQMCTCPQNIFIPRAGIRVGDEVLPYDEVVAKLLAAIEDIAANPKMGAGVLGAVQQEATLDRAVQARTLGGRLLLDSKVVENAEFPQARMTSPLVLEVEASRRDLIGKEVFGPVAMVIPVDSTRHAVQFAKELARDKGAISCTAHTTDEATIAYIEEEMAEVFTPVSFNFTGMFWVNQNAGFSDFHVTGGNPAGNASITDPLFVRQRFGLVGMRVFKP